MSKIIQNLERRLLLIRENTEKELRTLRTDRATPALVEDVAIEAYGARMKLKEVASISAPETRVLIVQPWDRNNLQAVAKALETADLGSAPAVQGDSVRVVLPPMSEERRRELSKTVGRKTEEAKIEIRQAREEALKELEALKEGGRMNEDEYFRAKDEAQKKVDGAQQEVVLAGEKKEEEVMTI